LELLVEILIAETHPIFIVSRLFKLLPVIVTNVPMLPKLGVNEVIIGACANEVLLTIILKIIANNNLLKSKSFAFIIVAINENKCKWSFPKYIVNV
jgi:hypothetical protein